MMIWKGYERKKAIWVQLSDGIQEFFFEGHKETTKNIRHNNVPTGTRNWHITVKFRSVTTGPICSHVLHKATEDHANDSVSIITEFQVKATL